MRQSRCLSLEIRVRSIGVLLAIGAVGTSSAAAQARAPQRFSEQVVVTADRSGSTLDRVPAFVTLVDLDAIARSPAHDVADLLRQTGVHVVDVSGNQRSYRVDLRGFGATAGLNTLVLVDGRRVNQPDLSGTDWAQIPIERVARIEVIRGSGGAVLFGDAASGGVVNVITRAAGPREVAAGVSGGSHSALSSHLSSSGTRGTTSYAATARYDRSDGHRQNAGTEGGDVGGQVSLRASDRLQFDVTGGYHGDRTGLPGALLASDLASGFSRDASRTPKDFADIDDGYVVVTPRASLGSRAYASVDASFRQRNSTFFSSFSSGQFTGETGTRTLTLSPKVAVQRTLGRLESRTVAGADVSNAEETITNTTVFGGAPSVGTFTLARLSRGLYVQNDLRAGRVGVTGGYRYDRADYSFSPSTPGQRDDDAHAGSLGATLALTREATVFGRASRAFRYPVLDELFDFFGNTIDTTLVPQRSSDVEGGVRIESGPTQASVSVFRLTAEDEIYFNPVGGAFGFGANENLDGGSRRIGAELAASTSVGAVRLGGTLTFTKATIDGGAYNGQRMPGVPARRATLLVQAPLARGVSLGLEGLVVGARRFEGDFGGTFGSQDAYTVVNAKVTHQRGHVRLVLDIKNLFDHDYSEYGVLGGFPTERAFYPSPGINTRAGVEVRF